MRTPDCGVIMFDFEIRQRRKGVCTLVAEPSDSSPYTMEDNSTFCFMRKSFQILSAEAMTSSELSTTNAITTTTAPLTTTETTGTTTETSSITEALSSTIETLSTTEAPLPVTDSSTTTTPTTTTPTPTTTTMTTTSSYAAVVLFYHYFKSLFIHKNLHWAYIAIM